MENFNELKKVNTVTLEKEYRKGEELILKYEFKYPQLINSVYEDNVKKINNYYKMKDELYIRFDVQKLYQLALEDYKEAKSNNIPYRSYEVYSEYELPYDKECHISSFTDVYQYTGGAHGTTLRNSATWNLTVGSKMTLSDFFHDSVDYKEYIINKIIEYIEKDIAAGNDIYFEDYKENVRKNFNSDNFYITEEGIVVFFQQYDIAPYSSGILTFLIPFEEGVLSLPKC